MRQRDTRRAVVVVVPVPEKESEREVEEEEEWVAGGTERKGGTHGESERGNEGEG